MALMEQFEAMQLTYKKKYERQVERQYKLIKPEATEEELAQLRESPQLMSQQVNKFKDNSKD
jgi:t-SNARE complex subunit (syntaxin)